MQVWSQIGETICQGTCFNNKTTSWRVTHYLPFNAKLPKVKMQFTLVVPVIVSRTHVELYFFYKKGQSMLVTQWPPEDLRIPVLKSASRYVYRGNILPPHGDNLLVKLQFRRCWLFPHSHHLIKRYACVRIFTQHS